MKTYTGSGSKKILFALITSFVFAFGIHAVNKLVGAQTETPPPCLKTSGDANCDGVVDILDLNIWAIEYPGVGLTSDFNSDSKVNAFDFFIWNYILPTPTPTAVITPTPTPTSSALWISQSEIMNLPTTGEAWDRMNTAAYGVWETPDLKDQNNKFGIKVLAGALVYARTGDESLRAKTRDGIIASKQTLDQQSEYEASFTALSITRQVGTLPIAADIIDLKNFDTQADNELRTWLTTIRTQDVGTHTRWKNLTHICEDSTANWGAFACPSRIAASLYLGDTADVDRAANIIRALMGEREYYPEGISETGYFPDNAPYRDSWACDPELWTGINPPCVKQDVNIDGVLVMDAVRGGECCILQGNGIMYSWEALQGIFVSTELLMRTGWYGNPYEWSNQALKRSMDLMQRQGWGISSVAHYVPWMANKRFGTSYPVAPSSTGRIMSWGDWMYQQ